MSGAPRRSRQGERRRVLQGAWWFRDSASLAHVRGAHDPGSGELRVTYDGQEPVTLKPGMYAYGPAKLPHKATCAPGDPCVLFIAFESAVDAFPVEKKSK